MRVTFIQGLDKDYQRHSVLQGADTLLEFLEKAREYEKMRTLAILMAKMWQWQWKRSINRIRTKSSIHFVVNLTFRGPQVPTWSLVYP